MNNSEKKNYRGVIFDIDYFEDKDNKELSVLDQYVREHDVKVGIVTLEKKPEYTKWLRHAPLPVSRVVGGGDVKVGRAAFLKKPEAKPMKVCTAWLDVDDNEVLSVCTKDVDEQASKAAGLNYIVNPSPNELITLLSKAPKPAANEISLKVPAPVKGIFGAVCGDIIGSNYESQKRRTKNYDFELFTKRSKVSDDSILTMAIGRWLMGDRSDEDLTRQLVRFANRYPSAYWGSGFKTWLNSSDHAPRVAGSNGSAMRVSPVGYAASSLEECMSLAKQQAQLTHNSPEAIAGAQSIAVCIFLLRQGKSKAEIKHHIEQQFGYNLDLTIDEMRSTYNLKEKFSLECSKCASEAITCWLLADDFEATIRNAVSLGGDADTIAAMAGAIACATPGMEIPKSIGEECFKRMPDDLKAVMLEFETKK